MASHHPSGTDIVIIVIGAVWGIKLGMIFHALVILVKFQINLIGFFRIFPLEDIPVNPHFPDNESGVASVGKSVVWIDEYLLPGDLSNQHLSGVVGSIFDHGSRL